MNDQEREDHLDRLTAWLQNLFLPTSEVDQIFREISKAVRINKLTPPGAKTLPALSGPNYAGKSTMMMRWAREKYLMWIDGAELDTYGRPILHPEPGHEVDLCPLAWIDLDAASQIKDVDAAILGVFNLPADGVKRDISAAAMEAVRRHRTQVVIVDDVHLLKTNWKSGRDVLDHIKHLNTRLGQIGVSLVLIGADLEDTALVNDPQIACRLRLSRFGPYKVESPDDEEDRVGWQVIVRDFEQLLAPHLPRSKPEELFRELAGALQERTQGYLGDLKALLCEAAINATVDGTHKILPRHLDEVDLSKRADEGCGLDISS
ncbi:TniB family NTP-binding protein [Mycolicibacterium baixiangningiae]|uniref:TniB family NTP-binding protein n=1 Tax=Mycolicibacterium baixiangningiae TaxID=2761578 RepID=UPI001D023160|nr:TniB family NTP-binding protein [Mycolicibacterium baixiangningiae]